MTGPGEGGSGEPQSFFASPWFMIILIMVVFYFVLILPQQRKMKKDQEMRGQLKEGDKVLTNGGIIGVIEKVKDISFILKVGKNSQIEVLKDAVSRKVEKKEDLHQGDQQ